MDERFCLFVYRLTLRLFFVDVYLVWQRRTVLPLTHNSDRIFVKFNMMMVSVGFRDCDNRKRHLNVVTLQFHKWFSQMCLLGVDIVALPSSLSMHEMIILLSVSAVIPHIFLEELCFSYPQQCSLNDAHDLTMVLFFWLIWSVSSVPFRAKKIVK